MIVTTQQREGVTVLNLFGNLDIAAHLTLKKKVRDLVDMGNRQFLMDVSGVKSIDSTGIGTLVALLNIVRSRNGDLRLAGTFDPVVEDIFRLCGLQRVFTVYEDIETGIRNLTA